MNYKNLLDLANNLTASNTNTSDIKEFIPLPTYNQSRYQFIREYRQTGGSAERPTPSYPQQEYKIYAVKIIRHPHIKETEVYTFVEISELGMTYG